MPAEAYVIPGNWTGTLAILPRPRGNDWLEDDLRGMRKRGIDVLVSLLEHEETQELGLDNEEALARDNEIAFHPFAIPDRDVPTDEAAFLRFAHELDVALRTGKAVGVHCRQGIGRSSLLAATLLVLGGDTAEHAWQKVSLARGRDVPDTPQQKSWVAKVARTAIATTL